MRVKAEQLDKLRILANRGATEGERAAANAALQRVQATLSAYRGRFTRHVPKAPDNTKVEGLQQAYAEALRRNNRGDMEVLRAQIEQTKREIPVIVADETVISPIYKQKPSKPK